MRIVLPINEIACLRLDDVASVYVLLANFGGLAVLEHDAIAACCDLVGAHIYCATNKVVLVACTQIKFPGRLFDTLILVRIIRTV